MKQYVKKVLISQTMGMFNEEWYNDTTEKIVGRYLEKSGYVYFVKNGLTGSVKIGCSKSINDRLKSFETVFHSGVFLVGYIYSDKYIDLEKSMHKKFEHKRVKNEWFNLDAKDFEFISDNFTYISVKGFFRSKSNIIENDFSGFDEGVSKGKYSEIYNILINMPEGVFIFNEEVIKMARSIGACEDWTDKKISRAIRRCIEKFNINASFRRSSEKRGFILNS